MSLKFPEYCRLNNFHTLRKFNVVMRAINFYLLEMFLKKDRTIGKF